MSAPLVECYVVECQNRAACAHGKPHACEDGCTDGDVCYDVKPYEPGGVRMWCEPLAMISERRDAANIPNPEEEAMSETTLVQSKPQSGPVAKYDERDQALLAAGGLMMSNARRQRDEVEDLILIQRIKESGAYRQIVAESDAAGDGEAWEEYCKLIGYRRASLNERLTALRELGPEVMGAISQAGLPQVGVRALLEAPDAMKAELKAKGDSITAEDLRAAIDMASAAHDRADRAQAQAEKERKRAEKAEKDARERAEKLADMGQSLRDAQAEAKLLREGKKNQNVEDIRSKVSLIEKKLEQVANIIGDCDWSVERQAGAILVGKLNEWRELLRDQADDITDQLAGD